MSSKIIIIFFAQTLLIQLTLSQCTSRAAVDASYGRSGTNMAAYGYNGMGAPLAYDGLNWGGRGIAYDGFHPAMDFTPTNGGGLPVTSMSPISPTGISVVSDNAYEGLLSVVGEVPFVSAVAFEGALPTGGLGAISYGCGNGVTAMVSEGIAPAPVAPGFGLAGYGVNGYGAGFTPASAMGPGAYGYGGCGRGMLY